ncbi:hypothetical protein BKA70DRAFT_1423942 [Coprinopsis sp. MPI-PUGE-AT-0042]|nr:hypothetical protein BKA70DRAFT_1423942 [Coprinopsis sp. MPI-PUGE-AT-0042]
MDDASLVNCRVYPGDLEDYRRANQIRNPCCLCAYIDNVPFTESHVQMATGQGAISLGTEGRYVAECAQGRCGYYVCLEDFYPLLGLRLKKYHRRDRSLTYIEATRLQGVGDDFRDGSDAQNKKRTAREALGDNTRCNSQFHGERQRCSKRQKHEGGSGQDDGSTGATAKRTDTTGPTNEVIDLTQETASNLVSHVIDLTQED